MREKIDYPLVSVDYSTIGISNVSDLVIIFVEDVCSTPNKVEFM